VRTAKPSCLFRPSERVLARAFSLLEIMVVVGLMSVIILGLMAMFSQTQRAFRLGMNQTDVLEAGRMATDLVAREVQQIVPSYRHLTNAAPNFYAELTSAGSDQALPGSEISRTNILQDVFFVTRENQTWKGVGYFVRSNAISPGVFTPVGSLYRYETNLHTSIFGASPWALYAGFNAARLNGNPLNVSRVLDGVVHFKVRTYDTNGLWIHPGIAYFNVGFAPLDAVSNGTIALTNSLTRGEVPWIFFYSNAAPAFVELELGVLEQQTYERYRGIPIATAQADFLRKQASRVHVFRQRIPVRNVDPGAYR
jgi:type II secretory pathway pseudopilin PulG